MPKGLNHKLRELGWSYTRLIAELRRQAAVDGVVLPKTENLIPRISRWVNNHQQPDDFYRDLLSRATGRQRFELFSDEAAVALLAARTDAGIAPIVAGGSHEDMNRRQLLARTAALAAALAADPVVSMSGPSPSIGGGAVVHAAPIGEVERQIVTAIRRVMFGLGSPGAGAEQRGALDVKTFDHRVHTAWRLRQGSHYVELGQALPDLLTDAHLASQELTGDQQTLAFSFLAHSYNTASSLLRKLGDDGLAMIAADRAVQTARTIWRPRRRTWRPGAACL